MLSVCFTAVQAVFALRKSWAFCVVNEEQKQVGVPMKQAAPMLSHTVSELLQSMRVRAQLA